MGVIGGFIAVLIIIPFFLCVLALGKTIAFRKALKKQMVKAVPELEQPKTKEDAVAMGQVFEEIGFFDYLTMHFKVCSITLFAVISSLLSFLIFFGVWMSADTDFGEALRFTFPMSLCIFALFGLFSYEDWKKQRGIIRKCRDEEFLSVCSEEECVSHFQILYDIYKDYRQRFLGDQDRKRWQVIRAAAAVLLLCLAVIIYKAVDEYISLGPRPKKNRQYRCEYQIFEDNSTEIVSYFGKEPQVSIPDSLDGHPVSKIGAEAFKGNHKLLSVEFPEGIVEIGDSAFENCSELKEAELPDGLKSIGNSAFSSCLRLEEAELPDGLKSIGDSAFSNCDSLTEIHIPDSVEELGNYMCSGCDSLRTVNLPRQIEEIPQSMVSGCGELRSCSIPETVRSIGEWAFSDSGITGMELPAGIKSIGNGVFEDCKNLSTITIPDSLEVIEGSSFAGCSSLEEIRVSEGNSSLKVLDGVLFSADGRTIVLSPRNRKLTEYEIPEGTEVIGPYAFESCRFLEKVILPQSLTDIGDYAFYNCEKLTELNSVGKLNYTGFNAFSRCPGLAEEMLPDAETNYGYWRSEGYIF